MVYIIKTIPSDGDQDGSKQKAVQEVVAEFQDIVCLGVAKNTEKK